MKTLREPILRSMQNGYEYVIKGYVDSSGTCFTNAHTIDTICEGYGHKSPSCQSNGPLRNLITKR